MKSLLILVLLVVQVLPAQALSLQDFEKKSFEEQRDYLAACLASLTIAAQQTDPALGLKVKSYYADPVPGHKYPEGIYALMGRIGQLERRAETDKTVDLSKIQVEDVLYSVTAEKFKLPPRDAVREFDDFKKGAPAPRTAPPSAPAGPPDEKARSATPPPQMSNDDPVGTGGFIRPPGVHDLKSTTPPPVAPPAFMVGRIDVSHFAGLKPGDTEQRVVSLYGQAGIYSGSEKAYGRGHLVVSYAGSSVKSVDVYSGDLDGARSRAGNDALLDLFGRTEAEAVGLLGPPQSRESMDTGTYNLYWVFAMPDRPEGPPGQGTEQTLVLGFRPGSGSFRIGVRW